MVGQDFDCNDVIIENKCIYNRLAAMKKINAIILWLMAVTLGLSLASCDTMSSLEYNIHNVTSDTVTITFYKELMSSPYQGYEIRENDSVTTYYTADSCNVAILAPNQHLTIQREWHGLYREELVVHAWRYISSIKLGDTEVNSSIWDNEAAWHHRTKGGGNFEKEEFHYYDLWFK